MELRRASPIWLVTIALALAACGDDDRGSVEQSGSATGTTGATATETTGETGTETLGSKEPKGDPVATIEVKETEYELNPPNPGVEDAGLVAFEVTNAGKIAHALEVEGPNGEAETDRIAPGKTAKMTVDLGEPGTYKWYCPIADHEDRGMVGEILIAGGGDGGSAPEEESEDESEDSGSSGGY